MHNTNIIYTTSKIIAINNGEVTSSGTSFYVKNRNQIYLITCYHVIKESTDVKILLLSNSFEHIERNTLTLKCSDFSFIVSDDIAWINITKPLELLLKKDIKLLIKTFDLQISASHINDDLDILDSVYFIGYPSGIIDNFNLTPLVRKSNFSTVYTMNFNDMNQFLIDGSVFPGSSGSPVFIKYNDDKILIGIVIGTYISGEKNELFLNLGVVSKIDRLINKLIK